MKPPVSLDKQYKTRDGRESIVHTINGPNPEQPVIASVRNGVTWDVFTWAADGSDFLHSPSHSDLIEVVPLWEDEVWLHPNGWVRESTYYTDHEISAIKVAGWRKIKAKQEEPT